MVGHSVNSRGALINYAKRRLGAPVVEINVADEQVEDLLDDAIQFFQQRHFDGVERMYLKHKFTQDEIDRGKANQGASSTTTTGIVTTVSYTHLTLPTT